MPVAIAMSSLATVELRWTIVHLIQAWLELGHEVWCFTPRDLELTANGRLTAAALRLEAGPRTRPLVLERLRDATAPRHYVDLGTADLLLMRVNPPDAMALSVAALAEERGVPVVNAPAGLVRTRSKAWLAGLPAPLPRPRTLVTHRLSSARHFLIEERGPIVVKPAMGSGGQAVHRVDLVDGEAGLGRAFDRARRAGGGLVVVQALAPHGEQGEKRLVWLDGQVVGAYRRLQAPGEFRHNLRCGALPEPVAIDAGDRQLAAALHPHLRANGIRIAGFDVIGGLLIEVNTANPGGVHFASARPDGAAFAPADDNEPASTVATRIAAQLLVPPPKAVPP